MNDPDSPGIYIHIPFCRTKCVYCDFYSVTDVTSAGRFFEALDREASLRVREISVPAGSVYVGGGTPSIVDPSVMAMLPGAISKIFGRRRGAEVTIEVNPDDVRPESLEAYLEGGFNRISIGVQSFDDDELAFLGRRHDSESASAAIEVARLCGFDRMGIDLIFGMAGQTLEGWRRTLELALGHGPDHISCYQLTVEPGTPLGLRYEAGEKVCAGEDVQGELYLEASRILTDSGFIHYEVSNFAADEDRFSRHNIRYWSRGGYLGLGPSAHSFDGKTRWWNHRSVSKWLEAVERCESPVAGKEELSAEQVRMERLMLGFRTLHGVEIALLQEHPEWEATLEDLLINSLVRNEGGRIIATVEGFLIADRLPLLFM